MTRRIASLVLSFALTAAAQQAPQPLRETIEVQLTNLDVIVTDANGNPVPGLRASDFEVLENGEPREITHLSEVSRAATPQGGTPAATPRRILVAIDNRTIANSARRKTISAVRTRIEQLLSDPNDLLMIVTITGTPKPRTQWTGDRAEIRRALDEIERDAVAPRIELAELDNTFAELLANATGNRPTTSRMKLRTARQSSAGSSPTNDPGPAEDEGDDRPMLPVPDMTMLLSRTHAYAASVAAETQQTIHALGRTLGEFGSASEGKKLVLLVGGALPIFPGADGYQRLEAALRELERYENNNATPYAEKRQLSSTLMERSEFDLSPQLDELASYARMKGIAFYAVNPEVHDRVGKDMLSHRSAGSGQDFATGQTAVDGFERLAAATGGLSHVGRTAELALTEVHADLDTYYSLGYRSPEKIGPDTKIVVRAKNGLRTRAVLTAAPVSAEWKIADAVVNQLNRNPDRNDLGIVVMTNPGPQRGEGRQVQLNVMIPFDRLRLVRDGADYTCSFTVFVSVGNASRASSPQRETKSYRWSEESVNQLRGKNIAYGVDLVVGPGRDRVSVGILDLASGTTGYGRALLAQ
jgi:VWFA-related protein